MNITNSHLVLPMLVYILYILCIYFYMFAVRKNSVVSGKTSIKYFKSYNINEVDPYVLVVGRHLENQYELPMLYFILNILTLFLGFTNLTFVILAWVFVISRFFHSYIHLTSNRIQLRMLSFTLGFLTLIVQTLILSFYLF